MADMAARGVVGFKAFMCDSGLPEFPRADDLTLLDGHERGGDVWGFPWPCTRRARRLTSGAVRSA